MTARRKTPWFFMVSLFVIFALMGSASNMLADQVDPISEIQQKLEGISGEEKEILQNLFDMEQSIEDMEAEEKTLSQEIDGMKRDLGSLETAIQEEEASYENKRDTLKEVLKIYQRKGPGSYLEIILDSENLNMFLWRISTLKDLSRNTAELLEALEDSKVRLAQDKAQLDAQLVLVEEKKEKLKESLNKTTQLKEEKESYLASLQEEREHYQEQLDNLQQVWNDLKVLFAQTTKEFAHIIEEGDLPPDAIKTTFSFYGIEGTMDEQTFNDIIPKDSPLGEMVFSFTPGKIQIGVPEKSLVLAGTFDILEGNTLKFTADEGSFYGIALEKKKIEELFQEGYLVFDLKPLVLDNTLESIEIQKGYLKFMIKASFFQFN